MNNTLLDIDGYDDYVISICPNGTVGDILEIGGIYIALPKKPNDKSIEGYRRKKEHQYWRREKIPDELGKIKDMDEWIQKPASFREKYEPYIREEFRRRREGYWFFNNGEAVYLTGHHYMFLQWGRFDFGFANHFEFQRRIAYHKAATFADPRSFGQVYVKCRRSGYSNQSASDMVDRGTSVKDKHLGIQSKTGKDAEKGVFQNKVVKIFNNYPFFFKPIQEGTTAPKSELSFREPPQKITKTRKTSHVGDALNTFISWRNTTNGAYDSEALDRYFGDEYGKWEEPANVLEAWRIQRTCLLVGKKIRGKAMIGSTVNPLDKGGRNFKKLCDNSNPKERNRNGRTVSGLYELFIPAYEALEGFFDVYGNPVIEDPKEPILGIDGEMIHQGSKTFLLNERDALKGDPKALNEFIRQFPFTREEAFRESVEGSLFDVSRIYDQIQHNDSLLRNPVIQGNFHWRDGQFDTEVLFTPDPNGRWRLTWMPPKDMQNAKAFKGSKRIAPNEHIGCGGVDSYDIDQTVDARASKGACHLYNKFNMEHPSKQFVAEYCSRPPTASIFYEDILMGAVFYGFPLLVENNKYGIVRYFEKRGYDGYLMDRPKHLRTPNSRTNVRTKGIPSNSADVIDAHAQAIEAYIASSVGEMEDGSMGEMYFNRTLEDWINFKISDRTKYDLSISSGLALLAAQKQVKEKKSNMSNKVFLRQYSYNSGGMSSLKK